MTVPPPPPVPAAAVGSTPAEPSYRALLALPGMRRILVGMTLGRVAGSMFGVAIVLFALDRYASPVLAGLVTFAGIFPGLLVSPLAGALLDRHGRGRLIIADHLVAGASLLAVAALALTDVLPPAVLVALTVVGALTAPLATSGVRSLFPLIVPPHLWGRVNALDSNGYVAATLVGPPAAGVVFQLFGGPAAMVAIAACYLAGAVAFVGMREPAAPLATTGRLLVDAWHGLRYTLANPTLRGLGICLAVSNVGFGVFTIVVPILVLEGLGQGEAAVGLVWAVSGVTGGLAAFVAGRWRILGREPRLFAATMLLYAPAWAPLLFPPAMPLLLLAMAGVGLVTGLGDIALFTLRQRRTDPAWTGRAFAVSMALNFSGFPVGAALGGVLVGAGVGLAAAVGLVVTLAGGVLAVLLVPGALRPVAEEPFPGPVGAAAAAPRPAGEHPTGA